MQQIDPKWFTKLFDNIDDGILSITNEDGNKASIVVRVKLTEKELREKYALYVRNINPNDDNFYSCFEEYRDNYEREWKAKEDEQRKRNEAVEEAKKQLREQYRREQEEFDREREARREAIRLRDLENLKRDYERAFGKPQQEEVKKKVEPPVHVIAGNRLITFD